MDGIISIHGNRQRAHAGYALIEVLSALVIGAFAAAWRGIQALDRARQMARVRREQPGPLRLEQPGPQGPVQPGPLGLVQLGPRRMHRLAKTR